MKQKDIKVGGTYYTYIGETLAAVVVVREVSDVHWLNKKRTTRYQVARVGETAWLPKLRSAAALRERDEKFY